MKRSLLSSIALLAICGSLRAQTYTFTQSTTVYQNLVNPTPLSNGELWDEDNFTLPLATRAGSVLGIEGSPALIERARAAAQANGVAGRTEFASRDLFELTPADLAAYGAADKWLLDPPREGAFAIAKGLVELIEASVSEAPIPDAPFRAPSRIVYVSCNPATLARDAGLLVHRAGYRCTAAGAVNMFPHTAHVESIAAFERA